MADETPVLKVSSNPTEAINEVALDELNRMHRRVVQLESENSALKRQVAEVERRLDGLIGTYNSNPHHV